MCFVVLVFFSRGNTKSITTGTAQSREFYPLQLREYSQTFTVPTLLDRSSCTSGVALTSHTCPQTSPQPDQSSRAGSWHQYPPQSWIRYSQPSVCALGARPRCPLPAPGDATSVLPPPTAPGAAEAALKIFGCCNQVRETGFFPVLPPCEHRGLPVLSTQAWLCFSLPHFSEGTEDRGMGTHHPHPGPTGREAFPGSIASKPLQYGKAMFTSWENSLKDP